MMSNYLLMHLFHVSPRLHNGSVGQRERGCVADIDREIMAEAWKGFRPG